jgi:hypothetical protein
MRLRLPQSREQGAFPAQRCQLVRVPRQWKPGCAPDSFEPAAVVDRKPKDGELHQTVVSSRITINQPLPSRVAQTA